MPKPVPKPISDQLFNWQICFWIWNVSHYALGLFAALGASLIATKKDAAGFELFSAMPGLPITLGMVVAIATAALTFLKASAKANAYIQAWRLLHNEVVCFRLDENGSESKLCEVHRKAEELIGRVD